MSRIFLSLLDCNQTIRILNIIFYNHKLRFLILGTIHILGHIILCCGVFLYIVGY